MDFRQNPLNTPVRVAQTGRLSRLISRLRGQAHRAARTTALVAGLLIALPGAPALAQSSPTPAAPKPSAAAAPATGWQACRALANDPAARLACFDDWAQAAALPGAIPGSAAALAPSATPPTARELTVSPGALASQQPDTRPVDTTLPATRLISVGTEAGCQDRQYTETSRFWELENGSDCGTFGIRGYRPISLALIMSDSVNTQPSSPSAGHTQSAPVEYKRTETRLQLSVRTKIAQGLLTQGHPTLKDSLWFGYTQQSYWQLFTPQLSRPFRSTDHEPEVMYVYPTDAALPGGWRWRYTGVGLAHQSNGQSLPLSRSWNRYYLMSGAELDTRWRVQGRLWRRINESANSDDNPGISNYVGRGEATVYYHPSPDNTLGATVRHSLGSQARGSVRLEWLRALGNGPEAGGKSGLRLHTQLFSGYGDSLLDYNRRRVVFSVGLSLVDF
ncbi:phospholipase A [Curvibacter microcysteis]|uniref:phospholipase A n=1 Tax=Curvibacter microcysteis TaxID=3026419 RepID=UPI00390812E5